MGRASPPSWSLTPPAPARSILVKTAQLRRLLGSFRPSGGIDEYSLLRLRESASAAGVGWIP